MFADGSVLSASGSIPSGSADFPFLFFLMALTTSILVGGRVFSCSSSNADGVSGVVGGVRYLLHPQSAGPSGLSVQHHLLLFT